MCCLKRKKQSCFGYNSLRELALQRSVRKVAVKNFEVINMHKKLLVCLLISALLLLDQVKSSNAVPWGRRDFAEWNLLKVMTFFRAKLDNFNFHPLCQNFLISCASEFSFSDYYEIFLQ